MFGTTFDPIDPLLGPQGGLKVGKNSPKFSFAVFKRKLVKISMSLIPEANQKYIHFNPPLPPK